MLFSLTYTIVYYIYKIPRETPENASSIIYIIYDEIDDMVTEYRNSYLSSIRSTDEYNNMTCLMICIIWIIHVCRSVLVNSNNIFYSTYHHDKNGRRSIDLYTKYSILISNKISRLTLKEKKKTNYKLLLEVPMHGARGQHIVATF